MRWSGRNTLIKSELKSLLKNMAVRQVPLTTPAGVHGKREVEVFKIFFSNSLLLMQEKPSNISARLYLQGGEVRTRYSVHHAGTYQVQKIWWTRTWQLPDRLARTVRLHWWANNTDDPHFHVKHCCCTPVQERQTPCKWGQHIRSKFNQSLRPVSHLRNISFKVCSLRST